MHGAPGVLVMLQLGKREEQGVVQAQFHCMEVLNVMEQFGRRTNVQVLIRLVPNLEFICFDFSNWWME